MTAGQGICRCGRKISRGLVKKLVAAVSKLDAVWSKNSSGMVEQLVAGVKKNIHASQRISRGVVEKLVAKKSKKQSSNNQKL